MLPSMAISTLAPALRNSSIMAAMFMPAASPWHPPHQSSRCPRHRAHAPQGRSLHPRHLDSLNAGRQPFTQQHHEQQDGGRGPDPPRPYSPPPPVRIAFRFICPAAHPIVAIDHSCARPNGGVVGVVQIHEGTPGIWCGGRLGVREAFRRHNQIGKGLIWKAVTTAHGWGCKRFLATVQLPNVRFSAACTGVRSTL